jgi:hypothetical protein
MVKACVLATPSVFLKVAVYTLLPVVSGTASISRDVDVNPLGPVQLHVPPLCGCSPRFTVAPEVTVATALGRFRLAAQGSSLRQRFYPLLESEKLPGGFSRLSPLARLGDLFFFWVAVGPGSKLAANRAGSMPLCRRFTLLFD